MTDSKLFFEQLINTDHLKHTGVQLLNIIGLLFDTSLDLQDPRGIEKGIELATKIEYESLSNNDKILFNYFLANGWESKRLLTRYETQQSWDFDQHELSKELFHLRKCITIEGFDDLDLERKCQIYTNLGNHFSHIGRFIEAKEYWSLAILIVPEFPMALGNIAHGLFRYAGCLYEQRHKDIFVHHTYKYLKLAIEKNEGLHYSAIEDFNEFLGIIEKQWPQKYLNSQHDYSFDLGKNKKLKEYRKWSLVNTLFLNPLNDLGALEIACHDTLHLPDMTVAMDAKPKYHILFNQIKQEYGTARFLFYEGTQLPIKSYGDKDISLVDTMDYAEYSYNLEKVKIAYRLIYSLFDKISYLLNDYLGVGVPNNRISFRTIWHDEKKDHKLRTQFINNQNLALRGLYWLSKDFFDKNDAHIDVIEPEARELAQLRNYIEHKSFKIEPFQNWGKIEDNFTYSIGRNEFEHKTFKQLKLIRAAIIYTSLAIHHEEKGKLKKRTVNMYLPDLPYDNKF